MKKKRYEKGSIMVEAAIYVPLVFCVVMAMLYLALFNMQEYLMIYEAQRVAAVAAREEAYLGYEAFGMGADNEIDFSQGNIPSQDKVTSYYKAHFSNLKRLYREVGSVLSAIGGSGVNTGSYQSRFADAVSSSALITLGTISSPQIKVNTSFLGSEIIVEFTHSIQMPGVLAYLGYDGNRTLRSVAYSYSVNPTEFVRNVDLAADAVAYIFEKLGMSQNYQAFLSKTDQVLGKIL